MKFYLFSFAILFVSVKSFSQNMEADWNPEIYRVGKIYPGYIIKLDGDTIKGFLKADTRCNIDGMGSSNQNTAVFYLHESDRKPTAKYKPSDLRGYKIADKLYESINYSGGLLKKPNFNLVVDDGAIRTYEWYATVSSYHLIKQQSGESWQDLDKRLFETRIVIAKNPKEPVEHSMLGLSFSKRMPVMVEDNKSLVDKVKSKAKGYTFLNLFDVISEYNNWYKSK